MEVGEEGDLYTNRYTVTTTSCIKIGSDENHFNVSLIVRGNHKTVSTDHNF